MNFVPLPNPPKAPPYHHEKSRPKAAFFMRRREGQLAQALAAFLWKSSFSLMRADLPERWRR
jgi:hypothetical protein